MTSYKFAQAEAPAAADPEEKTLPNPGAKSNPLSPTSNGIANGAELLIRGVAIYKVDSSNTNAADNNTHLCVSQAGPRTRGPNERS